MSALAAWWQWFPWLLAGSVTLAVVVASWRRGEQAGGRSFALLALAVGAWCLASGIEALLPGAPLKLAAQTAAYAAMALAPALWLIFVSAYLGSRLPLLMEGLLVAPGIAAALLAFSNARHGLAWSAVRVQEEGAASQLLVTYGSWSVQVLAPYGHAMMAAGAVWLLVAWLRSTSWTRWRFPAMAALGATPALAHVAFFAQREPPHGLDPTPLVAAAAVLLTSPLLLRRRWFETLPLAQRMVFDQLPHAQLVLDRFGRIVDLNPAAERLLATPRASAHGVTLAVLAPELRALEPDDGSEVPFTRHGVTRLVRIERHLLDRHGDELVTMEDATEQARTRQRLQRRGLLVEAVDALVSAPLTEEDAHAPLTEALGRIGAAAGVARATLLTLEGPTSRVRTLLAWHDPEMATPSPGADGRLTPHVRDPRRTWVELPAAGGASGATDVVLPMEVEGRPWGALVLERGDPEVLRGLRESLRSVAGSLAAHVQRRRAEASRARAERFQRALLELTRELLRHEVNPDLYRTTLKRALEVIPGAQAGTLLVRGEDGLFRYVAAVGYDLDRLRAVTFDDAEMAAFFQGRSAALIQDADTLGHTEIDEERRAVLRSAGAVGRIRATLTAPIVLGGRTVAGLQLDDLESSGEFDAAAVRMVETFAGQLGAVWRRLQLQADSQRAAEGQRLLAEIERLLLAADRLETFFPLLGRLLIDAQSLPLARVGLVRVRRGGFEPEFYARGGRDLAFERHLTDTEGSVRSEGAWIREALDADGPVQRDTPTGPTTGERLVAYPVVADGRPWGVMVFAFGDGGPPSDERLELLGQVVNSLELALARQRDHDRQERQLARMEALVRTGEALRTVSERGEAVRRALLAVHDMTRADACAVLLLDRERDVLRTAATIRRGEDAPSARDASVEDALAWRPLREDRTVTVDQGGGAFMGTPLRNREGEPVGVLVATRAEAGVRFEDDERGFLEAVAQACGGALVRLGLLERSHQQAEQYRELYDEARRNEERFRLLAENMSDTVCLHEPSGRYLYLSPSVAHVLGYEPEALVGTHPRELFHPEDRDVLDERILQPLREKRAAWQASYRIRHRDGHYLWFETNAQPVLGEDGEVLHVVSASRDVTERKRIEERLVQGALYDDLTGLPNRALLMDRLQHALDRARRSGTRFAVLFLDLDRFKIVNDSLGHGAGDELLQGIATRLSDAVRDADTVARLGGDEFCVLLEDVRAEEEVLATAERLQAALTAPFTLGDNDLFTSASIGIAFSHEHYREPEELLRDADLAMYRAKAAGKARHAVFDHLMHEHAVHQLELESSLHRAIERDELRVAYQPVFDLLRDRVVGVEALVRWQHPERGLLQPDAFVPIAEESGLIVQLDRWVLRRACEQLQRWSADGAAPQGLMVSVNLSAMHFALPDPGASLAGLIAGTGIETSRLKLEITENVLMERGETVRDALQVLREQGLVVQIDDFGTGYSSLSYLQELPIDSLKIDRRFVAGMDADDQQLRLVTAVVQLAQGLGIDVVAEGIEKEAQLAMLRELGCRYGQGFLWSPPLAPDEVAERFLVPVR